MAFCSGARERTRAVLVGLIATMLATGTIVFEAPPSSAGLLGNLLCPVTNTLGVTSAGWDDGATTPPTTMAEVDQAIGASSLQARGITGAGVGVALIDSGVVPVEGLDGAGKVINGPDLSFESQYPQTEYLDTYGHGTHMAGIIAGNDGPGGSFEGVAPGAHLVVLKVATHDRGAVDVSQILAAVDWVIQHRNDPGLNIRVLNLSYGTESLQSYQLDPLAFALENAWRHGIVTVVSGGNDGTSHGSLTDPAVDPYVLAVGAANLNATNLLGCTNMAPFSSRSSGRHVDVVAPGVSIESLRDPGSAIDQAHPGAVVDNRFFRGSGTSQAAAVVSGSVALMLQARPPLTPDQVKALLKSTASPLALLDQNAEGSGLINTFAAATASVPWASAQNWAAATGTGSINQARGGSYVTLGGVALTGEQDIMGKPWKGSVWAPSAAAATAWSGDTWNGSVWTGGCWCGVSWAGATWSSAQWSGAQWSQAQWSGAQWSQAQWSGAQWSQAQWSGAQWSAAHWGSG
jgi:serine protease AprX